MNELMLVPKEVLQAVINYMATRPYREVFGLIATIDNTAQPYVLPEDEKEDTEKTVNETVQTR